MKDNIDPLQKTHLIVGILPKREPFYKYFKITCACMHRNFIYDLTGTSHMEFSSKYICYIHGQNISQFNGMLRALPLKRTVAVSFKVFCDYTFRSVYVSLSTLLYISIITQKYVA